MESSLLRLQLQLQLQLRLSDPVVRRNYPNRLPSVANTNNHRHHQSLYSNNLRPLHHHYRYQLRCHDSHRDAAASNADLLPTPPSRRTFTALDFASLWIGLVVGVPSYYLAGSLLHLGMSALQALVTVTLGNLLLLPLLVLASRPAAAHGLPFPVLARASFGIRGSHAPSLLRGLLACAWFGIQTSIGARAIALLLPQLPAAFSAPLPLLASSPIDLLCFLAFWALQLALLFRGGVHAIKDLERFSAPVLAALTAALLCWAYVRAGGFGPMLAQPSRLSPAQFRALFLPSLTANVGFWATVAVNIPDFARYARDQRAQALGHLALPVSMGLFTFVGVAVTSATEIIFGEVVSDPILLLGRVGGGLPTRALAILGVGLATVTTNVAANVVAPANALVSLNPRIFTFRSGAVATAVAGLLLQPWRLMRTSESFLYTWLVGYSAVMGPVGGVMLADYYLVKRGELDVAALYSGSEEGRYYYRGGVNVDAMAALLAGVLPVVPGFLREVGILSNTWKAFEVAYASSWFVSFFVSGAVYWALSCTRKKKTTTAPPG